MDDERREINESGHSGSVDWSSITKSTVYLLVAIILVYFSGVLLYPTIMRPIYTLANVISGSVQYASISQEAVPMFAIGLAFLVGAFDYYHKAIINLKPE
jgi:hypothetical protein